MAKIVSLSSQGLETPCVWNLIPGLLSVANACKTPKLSWRFWLSRRGIGCCFDFFYRRNVENRMVTRLDSLPWTSLPDALTCLFASLRAACTAVTHLIEFTCVFSIVIGAPSSIAQPVDSAPIAMTRTSFPATMSFWSGGWAPATHTSEIKWHPLRETHSTPPLIRPEPERRRVCAPLCNSLGSQRKPNTFG